MAVKPSKPRKPRKRLAPSAGAKAFEFDWLRALHAAACFFREARGDTPEDIQNDTWREVERSQRLRNVVEKAFGEDPR